MNSQADSLRQLSRTISRQLSDFHPAEQMRRPLQHLLDAVEHAVPSATFAPVPHHYSALVVKAAKVGLGGTAGGIARDLLSIQAALPWVYHYEPKTPEEDLSERIAFAELIGPDGPMSSPSGRVGFTVMAEHTNYPMHAHPAVEIYLIVSGRAQWRTARSDRIMPPGELVLHRSNEPHAMHTADEPLLALWGWSGDIDSPAVYL